MFKFAELTTIVLMCLASLACQSYSTGLQQGVARADETAATGALHAIAVAQQTYAISNVGNYGTFQQLVAGGYLDSRFNSDKPALKDYVLTMEVGSAAPGPFYKCNADPAGAGPQGRHFYTDSSSSALHFNPTQPASASDPIVQP
jgi:Tfp pilus assembly protein PilE